MTNEPTTKIDSVKTFVKKNKTLLAYSAGVAVGATCMAIGIKTQTLLDISPAAAKMLKEGTTVLYKTKHGVIATAIIPELQNAI